MIAIINELLDLARLRDRLAVLVDDEDRLRVGVALEHVADVADLR